MMLSILILGLVAAQRLSELALARRNTRRLLAQGATEHGAKHYPLIVGVHAAWLAGLWLLAWDRPVNLVVLAVFLALQILRVWVIVSLGGRWTTRIIVMPGARLIRRGPYRFLANPNYLVVAGEMLVLPLVFGLAAYGVAFFLLNAAVLWIRIRVETAALVDLPARETTPT